MATDYPENKITSAQAEDLYEEEVIRTCSENLRQDGSREMESGAFSRPHTCRVSHKNTPDSDSQGSCIFGNYKNGCLSFSIHVPPGTENCKTARALKPSICSTISTKTSVESVRTLTDENETTEDSGTISFGRQKSASVCLGDISLEKNYNTMWTWSVADPEKEKSAGNTEETPNSPSTSKPTKMRSTPSMELQWGYCVDDLKETEHVSEELRTTVMMRNLPNKYDKESLLGLLKEQGYLELVDFLYIPIDFRFSRNMGYCFLNFTDPEDARGFKQTFQGFSGWRFNSDKKCDVQWSTPYQGLAAHIHRYRSSPVMHESVPESFRPMLLLGGEPVDFPAPLKKITAPEWRRTIKNKRKRKSGKKEEN